MLKLRIENYDRLPDGGPLEYSVDKRGFDFGRDYHLDWTLPDKNRIVSGKHCEIRFHDNAYWLTDTSTNGTFLNGSAKRMQSPYSLSDGDKLAVGDYIIGVTVRLAPAAPAKTPAPPFVEEPAAMPASGIWDAPQAAPPPIDARELMPRPAEADRAPEFLYQAAYVPPVLEPVSFPKPQPAAPSPDPWGAKAMIDERPPAPQPPPVPVQAPAQTPVQAPVSAADQPSPDAAREFIRRFAAGAKLPEELFVRTDAGDLAEQTGELLHLACSHIMSMLHARAEAKALSRSGNRTMIQASDNNPLKFMPTTEEALRVMLGPRSRGYLDARSTIEASFADLKMHQVASLAAMQAAVTRLFDDLSPEAITKAAETKKSLIPGGKSKQWDTFAERWTAKAGHREHGMLGAFLDIFAEQYDKLSKHKP